MSKPAHPKVTPLVCWGATGQSKVLREFLPGVGYEMVALFDNDSGIASPFGDLPLTGGWDAFDQWLSRNRSLADHACVVAIGGRFGQDRLQIQDQLERRGLRPTTLIHPTAFVASDARIGAGSQVLAQSAICAGAQLGRACLANTRASVDHDCVLGDGVHVGPGATLCGNVVVGDFAFVAAGATVLPRIRIGSRAIVGAGAVVTRDVGEGMTVVGVPARPLRA